LALGSSINDNQEFVQTRVGNPGQDERDSGMIPNGVPGRSRTGFRYEGEQWFRDEAEQFQADPGIVFGFAGMISTGT
jgi:hypothetical protein